MVAAAWPWTPGAGNPTKLQVSGYSQDLIGDGRIVSPMDSGPAKVRSRSMMPAMLQGTMIMTTAQMATLRTFIGTTLLQGTLPFTFYEPSDESLILVRFNPRGRLPSKSFLGPDTWLVALDLEVLPGAAPAAPGSTSLDFSDADNSGYLVLLEDI